MVRVAAGGRRRRRRAAGARRPGLIGRPVYKRCPAGAARLFAGTGEHGGAACGAVGAERSCDASRQPRLHQVLAGLRGAGQRRRPRERPGASAAPAARAPAPAARVPLPARRPRPPGARAGGVQRRPLPLLPSSGKRELARALPAEASAAASHPAEEGKALVSVLTPGKLKRNKPKSFRRRLSVSKVDPVLDGSGQWAPSALPSVCCALITGAAQ